MLICRVSGRVSTSGHRAEIVYQPDPYYRTITTFVKRLARPSSPRAVAVFNRGEAAAKVVVTRTQLGFATGSCVRVDIQYLTRFQNWSPLPVLPTMHMPGMAYL